MTCLVLFMVMDEAKPAHAAKVCKKIRMLEKRLKALEKSVKALENTCLANCKRWYTLRGLSSIFRSSY